MAKRTPGAFPRNPRDFYATPASAIVPLLPHLAGVSTFGEPCVGDGDLAIFLERRGWRCRFAADLEPTGRAVAMLGAQHLDALRIEERHVAGCDVLVTNPPWPARHGRGQPTLALIDRLAGLRPTWLLLAADLMHNAYFRGVLAYCHRIVSIGRVKWIEDSAHTSLDNCAWFLFDRNAPFDGTRFFNEPSAPRFAAEIEEMLA